MADTLPPFPVLDAFDPDAWVWPLPSFIALHVVVPRNDVPQPCLIETMQGTDVQGEVLQIEPQQRVLRFALSRGGATLALPFDRIARLTLTEPLVAIPRALGMPEWHAPSAEEERPYQLLRGTQPPLTGTTLGHIENEHGLFLFHPVDDDRAVQRVFVPRGAYEKAIFGLSAVDEAAEQWISTPRQLIDAIDRAPGTPVRMIGESLLALGLVTRKQLLRVLARRAVDDTPLGERLVAQGWLTPAALQTALAHKMGLPIVDLTRFPIDLDAARRVPLRQVAETRALPLLQHGDRLVVAVDRMSRTHRLPALGRYLQLQVLPAVATRGQIRAAFVGLLRQRVWSTDGSLPYDVFATTR